MSKYMDLFGGGKQNTQGAATTPLRPQSRTYRILLVDDEPNVIKALTRVFEEENYQIVAAADGKQALETLNREPVQLIVSDFKMPGMDGAELLSRVKNAWPDTIRIMLTGQADTAAVMGAINQGAVYKFILKPWNDDDLRITVSLALEQYDLVRRNRALEQENRKKQQQISKLSNLAVGNRSQIANLLRKKNLLSEAEMQELQTICRSKKVSPVRVIIDREWVTEKQIHSLLRDELQLQEIQLDEVQIPRAVTELIPGSFCRNQMVLPIDLQGSQLRLVMADPLDTGLLDDLKFIAGLQIEPLIAPLSALRKKIEQFYGESSQVTRFDNLETLIDDLDPYEKIEVVMEQEDDITLDDLLRATEEPPAIRLVNSIVIEAIRMGASDIHIHPQAKHVMVRYRIDGILQNKIAIPLNLHRPLVSRIKVMAELDISERRRPQDGRITVKTPMRIVDLRISCLPTINGEKVVLRILDKNGAIRKIEEQGFSPEELKKVLHMVNQPQGILLVTGPTGSGKTTTLYTLLQHTATPEKNYLTIEDPVEFYMDQAGQVSVMERIQLDFASILRAILRQDPDVILLGEIRDMETAEVAFHAAMTGHMVYSTLHTNSAMATVARLLDIGLKPYVVASGLSGVIAQRLLRRLCVHCREPGTPDPAKLQALGDPYPGLTSTQQARGCPRCGNSGYSGRVPIYEVLVADDRLRDAIASMARDNNLSLQEKYTFIGDSLFDSAYRRVAAGETSVEEVLRVMGPRQIAT